MPHQCPKCGASFPLPWKLKRHLARKTPCQPILDAEDIPEEKKDARYKCKFCGRVFQQDAGLSRHMKKRCKIIPRNGDTSGMERLYDHFEKKRDEKVQNLERKLERVLEEMKTLKGEERKTVPASLASAVTEAARTANVIAKNAVVDQSTKININIFGREDTSHISHKEVLDILQKLGPLGSDLDTPSKRAITSMTMRIFSDPKHPENLTCFMPNKKGKDALVHGESGWEMMPLSLALSPMATKSVDALFAKQPWPGQDGIDADAKIEISTKILGHIKKNEGDIVSSVSAPGSELRTIPIRNRDLLEKALMKLPTAGDD